MANLCDSEVILMGRTETLEVIKDFCDHLVNKYKKQDKLEMLQKMLDFKCESWGRSADSGIYDAYFTDNNRRKLKINVCTAWGPIDEYWNCLCDKFRLKWASYNDCDGEYWVMHDKKRKLFPDVAILDIWDENVWQLKDDFIFFKSDHELLSYLNNNALSDHFMSLKEWEEVLEETDCGRIRWINRYEC